MEEKKGSSAGDELQLARGIESNPKELRVVMFWDNNLSHWLIKPRLTMASVLIKPDHKCKLALDRQLW